MEGVVFDIGNDDLSTNFVHMPSLFNPSRKPGRPSVPSRKPGRPSVLNIKITTVYLTPEQIAWGKKQPGGLSNTVRRLMHNAMRRQKSV
ncbi:MAG: DUF2239 family protein [Armatimonadetes bacterium]|nr:DUF2239 family protein [Armatimonadota bacterium]